MLKELDAILITQGFNELGRESLAAASAKG